MTKRFYDWQDDIKFDVSPKYEREYAAREECRRRGIDPDDICADGGVLAWMVVDKELRSR